jgi:DsbC/DsbD-like thiol-disulfide interchange protein
MKRASLLLATLMVTGLMLACVLGASVSAQETGEQTVPVRWMLVATAEQGTPVRKGASVTAHLHAAIEPGWHVYSLHEEPGGPTAMRISLSPRTPFAISGSLSVPSPQSAIDAGFGMETYFYTGDVEIPIPLRATRSAAGLVGIDVLYQACNRDTCLRPAVAHLTAQLVEAGENQP